MKKIVAGILAFMLVLLSSIALAEKDEPVFEIHNGVQFGMTKEEVIALEAAAGVVLEKTNPNSGYDGLSAETTIAGCKNTILVYSFAYNRLVQAGYCFLTFDMFNTLENALIKKYGETDYNYITRKRYDKTNIDTLGTRVWQSVFSQTDEPWSHRIVQISDALTIAIDHHDDLFSYSYVVYSVLSMGDVETLSDVELNDL